MQGIRIYSFSHAFMLTFCLIKRRLIQNLYILNFHKYSNSLQIYIISVPTFLAEKSEFPGGTILDIPCISIIVFGFFQLKETKTLHFQVQKPHLGMMHPKPLASDLGFSQRHDDDDGHTTSALLPVLRTAFTTTLRSMQPRTVILFNTTSISTHVTPVPNHNV